MADPEPPPFRTPSPVLRSRPCCGRPRRGKPRSWTRGWAGCPVRNWVLRRSQQLRRRARKRTAGLRRLFSWGTRTRGQAAAGLVSRAGPIVSPPVCPVNAESGVARDSRRKLRPGQLPRHHTSPPGRASISDSPASFILAPHVLDCDPARGPAARRSPSLISNSSTLSAGECARSRGCPGVAACPRECRRAGCRCGTLRLERWPCCGQLLEEGRFGRPGSRSRIGKAATRKGLR